MSDLISRQAVIEINRSYHGQMPNEVNHRIWKAINELPSAQPEIIRCKECKHWKDSDGVYRRGIGAESKCPVNIRAVYEGNFYCGYAERRTDEA